MTLVQAGMESEGSSSTVRLTGGWTTEALVGLQGRLAEVGWPTEPEVTLDAGGMTAFDTGGAWLLHQLLGELEARGKRVRLAGLRPEYGALLALVRKRMAEPDETLPAFRPTWLERLGRAAWQRIEQGVSLLAFVGEAFLALAVIVRNPSRVRWLALWSNVESAGVNALPITGLLSFLIGVVIAYQGGVQLRTYGANIFIVELVTLTILRELAPLMAAIIVAGRTGSAYAAQIGTMKVTEEVDALRTIGIPPMDLLVLPKLFGLVLALPLLTVFADGMGILGGMVMAAIMLDVSLTEFADRIPDTVSLTSFWIGVVKAPVFAAIIALVGCFQGFQVDGGADSVGRQTTISVVQSIFLVIVADAAFSILLSWLGI